MADWWRICVQYPVWYRSPVAIDWTYNRALSTQVADENGSALSLWAFVSLCSQCLCFKAGRSGRSRASIHSTLVGKDVSMSVCRREFALARGKKGDPESSLWTGGCEFCSGASICGFWLLEARLPEGTANATKVGRICKYTQRFGRDTERRFIFGFWEERVVETSETGVEGAPSYYE